MTLYYSFLQVLHLEQLLTTGGGWQDQCGGLYGGAKLSQSQKGLPVNITTKQIKTPPGFLDELSQHILLVYTGKTRLARNLLQVYLVAHPLDLLARVSEVVKPSELPCLCNVYFSFANK